MPNSEATKTIVNTTKRQTILTIAMIVLIAVVLFIIFRQSTKNDMNALYNYKMAQSDSVIKALRADKEQLLMEKEEGRKMFEAVMNQISEIKGQVSGIKQSEVKIIKDYEKIPSIVYGMSEDSLIRAIAEYVRTH